MAESTNDSNFLSDIYSSAKELITERFSSPFIFSFIVAWLLINYRAVITAFTETSDKFPIEDKIVDIQNYINSASYSLPYFDEIVLSCYEWSFLAACFYTFIYPFIDYRITTFTLVRKKKIYNARKDAEEGIKYSYKDVQKIYLNNAASENELRRLNEGANITIEQLRAEISDLNGKIKLFDDVDKQKKDIETQLKNISEQYKKSVEDKNLSNVISSETTGKKIIIQDENGNQARVVNVPSSPVKPKTSPKNSRQMSQVEINKVIDNLTKSSLLNIKYLGHHKKIKGVWPDATSLSENDRDNVVKLRELELVNIKTNPTTLNKMFELTKKGTQIYKYLETKSPKSPKS